MKALIFPGQGSQYKGMGKDFFERDAESRRIFEEACDVLQYNLSGIMFDGDEETLRQTKYTQPAIFLHSYVASKFVDLSDVTVVAGHSLGEYTAVCVSGAMSFKDALLVVQKRGELMQDAGEKMPGSMCAVVGLSEEKLEALLAEANTVGVIQAANFNSPGQVVLSGEVNAIKKALEVAKPMGAKLAKELTVSGAFHSPLMHRAEAELKAALDSVFIQDSKIPICMNVNALPAHHGDVIRENLLLQLTSPVLWQQSIAHIVQHGGKEFVEVGPQKVLQGLVKRIAPTALLSGVDTYEEALLARQVTSQ
ncbi:MAG: ACP S-malonyltransferase [Chloroherpetonaceae bacterium]|nr:ACP S-malonyltransferase [Chloroherpetonaceae bacterium]